MQRQKKISKCLSTKLFIEYQKAMGEPIQYISDEHGFMFQRPPENDHFIERPALLTHLSNYFLQPGRQLLTLTAQGLGGVGKTQLAQHVYLHPPQPYALRAWFQAGSREQLSLQYIDLGKAQGVKFADELPLEEKVARVLHWLEEQPDCLLMYDDVSDKAMLEGLLPEKGASHILITTRHGKDWPVSQCLDVDVMEPGEAKDLIEEIAGEQDPTDLETLVNALGRLPLALAQAAWYMRQENCAAGAYLTLYQERQAHLMQHTEGLPRSKKQDETWEKHEAVWVTFNINFEALKQTCPQALFTLNQASWLASTPIPEILLQSMMDSKKTTLPEQLFEWTHIKKQLAAYSLMQMHPKAQTLRMHNLVQGVLRDQQSPDQRVMSFKQVCTVLDALFEVYEDPTHRVFLKHAECLYRHNRSIAFLAQEIEDDADLLKTWPRCLASIYFELGFSKENIKVLQRELTLFEKYYGSRHLEVASILDKLGIAYGQSGYIDKRCELQERALKIKKGYYPENHPNIAFTLSNLGKAYGNLGNANKQLYLQLNALNILEVCYGPNHPNVSKVLTNLGNAYARLGDFKKQKELQERALVIDEQHYGKDHYEVARTQMNLASTYGFFGDVNKQYELQSRALKVFELRYGREHPEFARALVILGSACGRLYKWEKQRELQERGLIILESYYGSNHFIVGKVLADLGNAYGFLGDAKKQCELQERALITLEFQYGSNHPEIGQLLTNLGSAYHFLGDVRRQCELQERALNIQRRYYGPDHVGVAKTLACLATGYIELNQRRQAIELLEQARDIYQRHFPPDHLTLKGVELALVHAHGYIGSAQGVALNQTSGQLSGRGVECYKGGDYAVALPFFQQALALQQQEVGSDAKIELATCYFNLGSTLFFLERYEEARDPLENAYQLRLKLIGLEDDMTQRARTRLDAALEKLLDVVLEKHTKQQLARKGKQRFKAKDYAAALPFFQQALVLQQQEKASGAKTELATCYFNLGSTLFFLERYKEAITTLEAAYQLRLEFTGPEDDATQRVRMRLDTVLEKLLDVVLEELQSVELEERRIQQITREAIQCCFVKDEAVALSFFEQTSHPSTQKVKARIALCAIPSNQDVERNLDLVNNERDAASHDESPEIPIISEPIEINNASIPWNRCTLFATGVVAVTAVGVAWYLNAKTDVIGLFQNVLSGRVSP